MTATPFKTIKSLAVQLAIAAAALAPLHSAFAHGDVPESDLQLQRLLASSPPLERPPRPT